MIRAVIIDDEKNNIENLAHLLQQNELPVTIVGSATNADEGVAMIMAVKPDLLFLDIQMPGKNGFYRAAIFHSYFNASTGLAFAAL